MPGCNLVNRFCFLQNASNMAEPSGNTEPYSHEREVVFAKAFFVFRVGIA